MLLELTLKESSRFSPPHTSMPVSYVPRYSKYFLFTANNPPAMVGDLKEQRPRKCRYVSAPTFPVQTIP